MNDLAVSFMELFKGLDRAYGTFKITGRDDNGKLKGEAMIVREMITELLWSNHLDGKQSLGVTPINDTNMCRWGCLDIDVYNLNIVALCAKIVAAGLPLLPCRSKSGGCHLFIFLREEVPAAILQPKLRAIAAFLGYAGCEIFPKQTEILSERGDIGSWLNMPYFDCDKTVRYGLDEKGEAMTPDQFIMRADTLRLTAQGLQDFEVPTAKAELFKDGPPCLQHLAAQGVQPGMRNTYLFAAAKYFKERDGDNWKTSLDNHNSTLSSPLPAQELIAMIKSRGNKDYYYQCKAEPLKSCCNAQVCRLRKYGVGGGNDVIISSIRKYPVDPCLWFISLEDGTTLECTTDEMMMPTLFAKKCVEAVNKVPKSVKSETWRSQLNEVLENVTVIDVPKEATSKGQFIELLERFCTGRVSANTEDEIPLGKPYTTEGRTYFRLSGLLDYLTRQKFTALRSNQVLALLKEHKDLDCKHHGKKFKTNYVNYWSVLSFSYQDGPLDIKPEARQDAY